MWLGKWYLSRSMLLLITAGALALLGLLFLLFTLVSSSSPASPTTPAITQDTVVTDSPQSSSSATPSTGATGQASSAATPSAGTSGPASQPPASASPTASPAGSTTGIVTTTTGQGDSTGGQTSTGAYSPPPGEIAPPVPPAFSGTDTPQALTAKAGMKILYEETSLLSGSRTLVDAVRLLAVAAEDILPATAALPAQIRPTAAHASLIGWAGGQPAGGPEEGSGLTLMLTFPSGQCRIFIASAGETSTLDKFDTQPFASLNDAMKAVTCGAPAN